MKDLLKLLAPYLTAIGSAIEVYATKGDDRMFTRSECDDIFRGILRESGVVRFKAGAADLAVGIFAGNRRHWGADSYKVGELVHLFVFV